MPLIAAANTMFLFSLQKCDISSTRFPGRSTNTWLSLLLFMLRCIPETSALSSCCTLDAHGKCGSRTLCALEIALEEYALISFSYTSAFVSPLAPNNPNICVNLIPQCWDRYIHSVNCCNLWLSC